MKRDMDLVRNILLEIESKDNGTGQSINLDLTEVDQKTLQAHLLLMFKSGFIEGKDGSSLPSRKFFPQRLTWAGHDFLDSVRS